MINVDNIKLVIWDLDDTFWKGTLSEENVEANVENIKLVKSLTDRGIVNTICSKNDYDPAIKRLQEFGIEEYFVFKSIDWTPKGQRINQLIKDMGLRPVNCLFLDDNVVNLNEAQFYSKDLMIAEPSEVAILKKFCDDTEPTDTNHKRLTQYKVLEKKQKAKLEAGDNLQFLFASNTKVEIHKDCEQKADRIWELINRTNQLNFTKNRCTRQELDTVLADKDADCGYVTVKDNFGDYGIVGFYAVKNNKCIHFLFSCRTIGQGVEQWVYSSLGWPELEVVGEVVNKVEKVDVPAWINQNKTIDNKRSCKTDKKIVFKGPCDLELLASFLSSSQIFCEFTYVGKKNLNSIEHHNHSVNYLQFPFFNKQQRRMLIDECIFNDEDMFTTKMFDEDVSLIFLSTLIEANLGIYQRKADGIKIAFGEWCYPLTDETNWEKYISGSLTNYGNKFNKSWLSYFTDNYTFIGRLKPNEVLSNIENLLTKIGKNTHICLILGSEMPYKNNTFLTYKDRELYHIELNQLIRDLSSRNKRVHVLDFNKYIKSQDDFMNNINHFQRKVYYEASRDANKIIELSVGKRVREKGLITLAMISVKAFIIEQLKKQPKLLALLMRLVRCINR